MKSKVIAAVLALAFVVPAPIASSEVVSMTTHCKRECKKGHKGGHKKGHGVKMGGSAIPLPGEGGHTNGGAS